MCDSGLLQLFGDAENTIYKVRMPSRTIFSRNWDETSFVETSMVGQDILRVGDSNMTYSVNKYTTVENTLFGVKSGTPVTLMLININSALSTEMVDEGPAVTAKYADLAQETYHVLKAAIDSSCSSSEKAADVSLANLPLLCPTSPKR